MQGIPLDISLEALEARLKGMTPQQLGELAENVKPFLEKMWLAQPGPQTEAYYSEADETLYGGAAGGGKTDVIIGLATTAHYRSLIFRSQAKDLDGLWSRLEEVAGSSAVKNDTVKKAMRLADGRTIEGGHLEKPGSEKAWQGRPHDLIAFDEAAQLDEYKVSFVLRWLRSVQPGVRCRAVFATNPPMPELRDGKVIDTGTGSWLKDWFAPWLEPAHPQPAKSGELRWCYMRASGDRQETVWVEGPGWYDIATGERHEGEVDPDNAPGNLAAAKSRTFIRSLLKDNAFLRGTGYAARLSGTPEPLRSMLLNGDFTVKGEDHPFQVIPTQWVLAAQERWKAKVATGEHRSLRMLVLSGDVAQGGLDTTVLAALHEQNFFSEPTSQPGRETPTGDEVVALIQANRKHRALIVLDGGGGWAGSTRDQLRRDHQIDARMFQPGGNDGEWTDDLTYAFFNNRAAIWWRFREALDPDSMQDICLPPSTRLLAQLTAPQFEIRGTKIIIEDKESIRKRLGSSTDEADAVLQAWHYRDEAIARVMREDLDIVDRIAHGKTAMDLHQPVEMNDPLAGW